MKARPRNDSNDKNSQKESADWLNNLNPNKVISNAERILSSAVNVLEEEIAAGILAAKKLEKKVIDVDEIRGANPEELMSRIRRDTHDAIDIFLDAVTVLTNHISSISQSVANKKETPVKETGAANKSADHIPVVKNEGSAKIGEPVEISLLLSNDSKDQQMTITLHKPDLIGPIGNKIRARYISLEPQSLVLDPGAKKEVAIKVRIPLTCKPGIYSGLIQDENNTDTRFVLTIGVENKTPDGRP